MNNVSIFISKRKNSITESRIKNIFWYIGECYLLLVNDGKQYSKKFVSTHTTIHFEDYLKFRLVEDYLVQNKELLKAKTSQLDEINFTLETQKEFIDLNDGKQKPDKIDVFINKLGLSTAWGECDEKIYFAIECKRISCISDTSQYVKDINKFSNRSYIELRLPFEGQLAFVESNITHNDIVSSINAKILKESNITTSMPLCSCVLNNNITSGTYISKHKRNVNKSGFSIYHLLLDYSKIVTP